MATSEIKRMSNVFVGDAIQFDLTATATGVFYETISIPEAPTGLQRIGFVFRASFSYRILPLNVAGTRFYYEVKATSSTPIPVYVYPLYTYA